VVSGKSNWSDQVNRDNRAAFSRLTLSVRRRQCLALVGAGVSASCGYPTWGQLLDRLHDESGATVLTRRLKDVLWRAEVYRRELGDRAYGKLLSKVFGPRRRKRLGLAHTLAGIGFRHFLTTNYDDTLEKAHRRVRPGRRLQVIDWADEDAVRRFITGLGDSEQTMHCVHLHGRSKNPKSIVLTDSDYTTRYARTTLTTRKLFAVLATQQILFVGFSLEDPDLVSILRDVNAALGSEEPRHFAFLPLNRHEDDPDLLRSRMRRKFGIDPVFYPSTKNHERLLDLLRLLKWRDRRRAVHEVPLLHRADTAEEVAALLPQDPDDAQKGRFGGRSERRGRRLRAHVADTRDGWFKVTLTVDRTRGALHDGDCVEFHLHQTFKGSPRKQEVKGGKAVLPLDAWGAFTVGAVLPDGTELELDLASLKTAPKAFREG